MPPYYEDKNKSVHDYMTEQANEYYNKQDHRPVCDKCGGRSFSSHQSTFGYKDTKWYRKCKKCGYEEWE